MSEERTPRLRIELADDRQVLRLTPTSAEPMELSAEVAGEVIHSLIRMRARMPPSAPLNDPGPATRAITHPDMRYAVAPNEGGGITLFVLHPGTGWLALPLSREGARRLLSGVVAGLSPPGEASGMRQVGQREGREDGAGQDGGRHGETSL